jgi:hypothetical protein
MLTLLCSGRTQERVPLTVSSGGLGRQRPEVARKSSTPKDGDAPEGSSFNHRVRVLLFPGRETMDIESRNRKPDADAVALAILTSALTGPRAAITPSVHVRSGASGELNGHRHRQSLKTRDWQRAIRLAERFEVPMPNDPTLSRVSSRDATSALSMVVARSTNGMYLVLSRHTSKRKPTSAMEASKLSPSFEVLRGTPLSQQHGEHTRNQSGNDRHSDAHAKFRHGRGAKNWIVRGFFRYWVEQEWTNRSPAAATTLAPKNLQATNSSSYGMRSTIGNPDRR